MNKFFYFLIFGLVFTGLQVATAAADDMDCVNAGTPSQVADCWNAKAKSGSMKHEQNQHDGAPAMKGEHHGGPPGTMGGPGHHPAGAPGMKGEHHGGPPGTMGGPVNHSSAAQGFSGEHDAPQGHHPEGAHHDGPPPGSAAAGGMR